MIVAGSKGRLYGGGIGMSQDKMTDCWIYLLRFGAGFINAIAMIKFSVVVATQTGILGDAIITAINGELILTLYLLSIALSFLAGSTLSGILFPDQKMTSHGLYPLVLFIYSLAFFIFYLIRLRDMAAICAITFIIGLQNGMFLYHKGSIIRTTMITGNITDIGVAIGRRLSGKEKRNNDLAFQFYNILCFLLGIASASLIATFTTWSLFLSAAVIYFLIAGLVAYGVKTVQAG